MWFDDLPSPFQLSEVTPWNDGPRTDYIGQFARLNEAASYPFDFHPYALRPYIDGEMMSGLVGVAPGRLLSSPDEDSYDMAVKSLAATETPDGGEIVVTGTRLSSGGLSWSTAGGGSSLGGLTSPSDSPTPPGGDSEAPADEAVIEIKIHIMRELTASEKQALQDLQNSIASIDAAIKAL